MPILIRGAAGSKKGRTVTIAYLTGQHTFVVPDKVKEVTVEVVGGGGDGGYGYTSPSVRTGGAGGSGGAAAQAKVAVSPGETIPISVGEPGGTSSFGTFVSCTGGGHGYRETPSSTVGTVSTTDRAVIVWSFNGRTGGGASGTGTPPAAATYFGGGGGAPLCGGGAGVGETESTKDGKPGHGGVRNGVKGKGGILSQEDGITSLSGCFYGLNEFGICGGDGGVRTDVNSKEPVDGGYCCGGGGGIVISGDNYRRGSKGGIGGGGGGGAANNYGGYYPGKGGPGIVIVQYIDPNAE